MGMRDASSMWLTTADCIRVAAREVLGVTKGFIKGTGGGMERFKVKWKLRKLLI